MNDFYLPLSSILVLQNCKCLWNSKQFDETAHLTGSIQDTKKNFAQKFFINGGIDDGMATDHSTSYTRDTKLDHHNPNSINHPELKK